MNVAPEQLIQIIGSLYVETVLLRSIVQQQEQKRETAEKLEPKPVDQ